jgi:hypothetical protein
MATVADHQGSVRRAATAALSIVIPTRDRVDTLQRTLDALEGQRDLDGDLQIVVVDDGSRDGTAEILRSRPYGRHALRSSVRNQRARRLPATEVSANARATVCSCSGDDTIPQPQCVAAHLEAAAGRDVAVQGMIDWDPEVGITPLMEFMAPEGPQFYFKGLDEGDPVDWTRMAGSKPLGAPRLVRDRAVRRGVSDGLLRGHRNGLPMVTPQLERRLQPPRVLPASSSLRRTRSPHGTTAVGPASRLGRWYKGTRG